MGISRFNQHDLKIIEMVKSEVRLLVVAVAKEKVMGCNC
jgi:hypothetical protein